MTNFFNDFDKYALTQLTILVVNVMHVRNTACGCFVDVISIQTCIIHKLQIHEIRCNIMSDDVQ